MACRARLTRLKNGSRTGRPRTSAESRNGPASFSGNGENRLRHLASGTRSDLARTGIARLHLHEPGSSRGEEVHSIWKKKDQSLLTSAATRVEQPKTQTCSASSVPGGEKEK